MKTKTKTYAVVCVIWMCVIVAFTFIGFMTGCHKKKIEITESDSKYRKAGAPCVTARDCQPGLSCMRDWNGLELKDGVCTNKCGFHEPMHCHPGDLCVSYARGSASYCLPQCSTGFGCRDGYECVCLADEVSCGSPLGPRACLPIVPE